MYNVCFHCVYDDGASTRLYLTIYVRNDYLYIVRCHLWDSFVYFRRRRVAVFYHGSQTATCAFRDEG